MRRSASFSFPIKLVALLTGAIFAWNQIVWAGEILPQTYSSATSQPIQTVSETPQAFATTASLPASASTDFLGQTLSLTATAVSESSVKTVSYNPKLTATSVTTISGSPYPYRTEGSSAGTDLSYAASTTQYLMKYDVTNAGDTSGFTISFDNASTVAVETRNLSTLANLTFGLKGSATSVTFEIVDSQGRKDSFLFSSIAVSTERFWRLPLSSVSGEVDKTRIKQLNFIVAQTDTVLASRKGTLSIRVKGLKTTAPAAPLVTSAVPLVTNAAKVTLSGTKEANASILINGVEAVARNASTAWTAIVPLTVEGSNTIRISAKNSIGLISAVKTVTVKKDTVAPTGSININSSAAYASSQTVTLNLSGVDRNSGISLMSFSTDSENWTAPVTYTPSKSFTLPAGDGTKTVYVKYYDRAGNVSAVYSKSIVLDTQPPQGTVKVNGGVSFINQNTVRLDLAAADAGLGVGKMSFSTNGTIWSVAEVYATSKAWTFASGDGAKKVYVKFQDKAGKWSAPASVTVTLDTVKPSGSITINSGAAETNSASVMLDLLAADNMSGIDTMSFSADNVNWTAPEVFANARAYDLPAGEGLRTVYVRFYDKAGNVSAVYFKNIQLKTPPPVVVIDPGTPILINQKVLTLHYTSDGLAKQKTFTDLAEGENTLAITEIGLSGIPTTVTHKVTVDTIAPVIEIDLATPTLINRKTLTLGFTSDGVGKTKTFTGLEEGSNNLSIEERDAAGNETVKSFFVRVDTIPPVVVFTAPILINQKTLLIDYTVEGLPRQKFFAGLVEGGNILMITETDLAGNQTTVNHNVTVDTIAPVIVLTSSTLTKTAAYTLTYTIDGVARSESRTLMEGANALSVTATDLAGNTATETFSATLDTIAPVIVLTSPTLIKTAAYTLTYTVDGVAQSEARTLVEGANALSVTATDLAGNTATKTFAATLDTVAPVISNVSASNLTVSGATVSWATGEMGDAQIEYGTTLVYGFQTTLNTALGMSHSQILPGLQANTLYHYRVKSRDRVGNLQISSDFTFTTPQLPDTTSPTGSVDINSGAIYATSTAVNINLLASDGTGSGLDKMSFSNDNVTWTVPEIYAAAKSYTLPSGDGTKTVFVKYYDKAGNVSAVYSKSILLDTAAPVIVMAVGTPALINTKTLTVNYTAEGVAKTKTFTGLIEGLNGLSIVERDAAGNETVESFSVTVDTIPPAVVVDAATPTLINVKTFIINYRSDGVAKTKTFSDLAEGSNTLAIQETDAAGNQSVATWLVTVHLVQPVITITSPAQTDQSRYPLVYTLDGEERRENWNLQPGVNEILLRVSNGGLPVYISHTVRLNISEASLPGMPSVPSLSPELVSMTAQNGLVMKYEGDVLVAIELPGEYTLYSPGVDASRNLVSGLLVFSNGDRLLYQNGRPVYTLSTAGEKTVYNPDGTVARFVSKNGDKTRFAYQMDAAGKVTAILSMESGAVSRYDDQMRPVWIRKTDGTQVYYEEGFLTGYVNAAGDYFRYRVTPQYEGETRSGNLSEIVAVKPAGNPGEISFVSFLENPGNFPSARNSLNSDLVRSIQYDPAGKILQAVSGQGESLELQNGLPTLFKDATGKTLDIQSRISQNGDLLSVSFTHGGFEQIYDDDGQLSGLRLSDGTLLNVTGSALDQVILEDGSILTQLVWNGQSLTGFRRGYPDGLVEVYQNSVIVERTDAEGNKTVFISDFGRREPENVYTEDGKTYQVIRYAVSPGITERLTQLVKIDMPDGGRIEFDQGRPVRYVQEKEVQIEPFEVPQLLSGQFFVPVIDLPQGKFRSLTVNQNGYIYSGEILFNDGTQYLIENNVIVKQISVDGQFVEFSMENVPVLPQPAVPPVPLTPAEAAYRDELVETQLDYFSEGKGIHAGTGLPVDNYKSEGEKQSDYSQATLVGFWAEILAAIARDDYQTSKMSRAQAFEKLNVLLENYQKVQQQVGWNGMVAFFKIVEKQEPILDAGGQPTGQTQTVYRYENCFNQYGFGDAINLSVSLSSVIGALQGLPVDPSLGVYRDRILSLAHQILAAQEPGYAAFYDPAKKRFRGAYALDPQTGQWGFVKNYYMDRIFNEFRPGMAWLAARYPQYRDGFYSLDTTLRRYQTSDGQSMELAVPFDGGAFQMFWPLIHVDETQYADFDSALRNFLYAQAEFTKENGVPGLLSAGDRPGYGYEGKIGDPEAAEADDLKYDDIGSLYGTAAAFGLAPHYTLQFMKNLETAFPQIRTNAGFVDAIKLEDVREIDPVTGTTVTVQRPSFSSQYYGVDQASFILSLLKTSQTYFSSYLSGQNIKSSFDALYNSVRLNLSSAAVPGPAAPEFGETTKLYAGSDPMPDGIASGLVKQSAFVSTIWDASLGEGHVFNYHKADGSFHHAEIEFGEGAELKRMALQEYLMFSGRAELGRALFEGFEPDLYNRAASQGVFYDPRHGYVSSALTRDPVIGEVRHIGFDFKEPQYAVGLWNKYENPPLDLSQYDFLSIPVRIDEDTPETVRVKFEFKGSGNIFITDTLKHGWQYITIPVVKPPDGPLYEIATVIQPVDGKPLKGEIYLGPLSAFKVRTSNHLDWNMTLGKSAGEIVSLIQKNIAKQAYGGGWTTAEEVLENFTIDSTGQLLKGVLKRADGSVQYFEKGQLVKWVFRNGRTVLYEKGIASFVVDLSRGKLETARFYYDQDLKGTVRSFNLQDNDSQRVFGQDGQLQSFVQDGYSVSYSDGHIASIQTSKGTFTNILFGADGSLLRAHVALSNGRTLEIDEQSGSSAEVGGGTKIFYRGTTILGIETVQNGRTDFIYRYDVAGRVIGVDATFQESGQPRTMSLFEYVQRPERTQEKAQIISRVTNLFSVGNVGAFSVGGLPAGELTQAWKGNFGDLSQAKYQFRYQTMNPVILGMCVNHPASPVTLSDYGFVSITLKQDPSMTWNQDFSLNLKAPTYNVLYSFEVNNTNPNYQTFWLPLAGKSGSEGEITLEVIREQGGVGQTGTVFIKDLSYISVKTLDKALWESEAGLSLAQLQNLKTESDNLTAVGAEIARKKPLVFTELTPYLDIPTRFIHTDTATEQNKLSNFRRFDGTQVELNGSDVKRMVLPDGTVNEYAPAEGATQSTAQTVTSTAGSVSYNYGALRRITQADGREYLLSYEFMENGEEITVFKDTLSGEERRFKDGKLLTATDPGGLMTNYSYANGEMIGAELTYNSRVLNSTRYVYNGDETQVTDERGTTWFYDANGNLIKHLTKDGFLYEYSEYSQPVLAGQTINPHDYKSVLYAVTGLKAVSLKGYQAAEGSWITFEGTQGSEVHLVSGTQAVNLEFDEDQRIKSGQIQFADGLILEIENYMPVRGRFASGQTFAYTIPQASDYELLQGEDHGYLGFRFKLGDRFFTYNAAGELAKAESGDGVADTFVYAKNAQGKITGYTDTERRQLSFNGVPFPKECELGAGADQKLLDSGSEIASHSGSGFLVSVFKEATNQWDVYAGTFASAADKAGLKSFLSGIKPGEYVAAAVSDPSFSSIDEEILVLFEGLGAGQIRQAAAANQAWTFFGNERLSAGQGSERSGAATFSTLTTTLTVRAVASGEQPVFKNAPLALGFSPAVYQAYDGFLKAYQPLTLALDLQRITVYNEKDEIVYTSRVDGISSFYERGKVRETFGRSGELLTVHEYACSGAGDCGTSEDMTLAKITLVKARQDFGEQSRKATEQIEQAKFDALYRLAAQDEVARLQIKENVDLGVAQINAQISSLEAQRFQRVKQCKRGFLGIGKTCKEYTFEVPGVQSSIDQLANQCAELIQTGQGQLAEIPGAMAAKKIEIEQATAGKWAQLEQQKAEFLLDILRREIEPIVTDFYRSLLGRDPSGEELDQQVERSRASERIDIRVLKSELQNSSERVAREGQKATILQGVRTFLESYLSAVPESRGQMLQGLRLNASEGVALSSEDVSGILAWLGSRDLHFGQSAFLSLKRMLASRGVEVSMEDLGKETILIDILTGVINKFSEGDLLISLFALDRAAAIHGRDFASVKFTYDDLRDLFQSVCGVQSENCGLRVIAHIGEDHFVVLKRVTDSEVIYEETNKGTSGEDVTLSKDAFLKLWIAKDNAGYLLVSEEQAVPAKKISDAEAMKIRGAFFFVFIFIAAILSFASMVASVFSPTLGKILGYAALVAGIIGIVACLGQIVVQGLQMAFAQIAQQGFLATIKQGIVYVGKILIQSVRYVGRFIQNGFAFLKDCFAGGLSGFGSGISKLGNFLIKGAGDAIYRDGVLIGHKFTFVQQAARQLVAAGLSLGVSRGLEGLGVSPQIIQLAGAFVGGGCLGIGSVTSSFIQSGLQQMALQGVSQMAAHIGLAPPITDALFLAASAGIRSFFDPVLTLQSALLDVAPTVAAKLTMGGLDLLGRSLGLDPRLAQLLGLPLAALAGNIVSDYINKIPIQFGPNGIFDMIKEAVLDRETLGGILSIGAGFVVDKLGLDHSFFTALTSRIVAGVMADFLTQRTRMSLVDSIIISVDNSIYHVLDPRNLPALFTAISEKGLAEGFDHYATSILTQDTIEEFTSAGMTFAQIITAGMPFARDIFLQDGPAKVLQAVKNGKTIELIFKTLGDGRLQVLGIHEENQNVERLTQWTIDEHGNITGVTVEELMPDGTRRQDTLSPSGDLKKIDFKDWDNKIFATLTYNSQGAIEFNNYNLGIAGHLSAEGQFQFNLTGAPDLQDFDNFIYDFDISNLDAQKQGQFFTLFTGNGFWNEHGNKDDEPQLSIDFVHNITDDQARNGAPAFVLLDEHGDIAHDANGNVLTTASLPVTLYSETGLIGNVMRWTAETWLGCNFMRDKIESDLKNYFDLVDLNIQRYGLNPDIQNIYFAHSGNFQPLIKALEDMSPQYQQRLKTLIVYEGPYVGDGIINDPYLQTLIRIRGSADGLSVPFLDRRDFKIIDQNGNASQLPNQYNIEIAGAGHRDFDAQTNPKVNLFMRDLTLIANDPAELQKFFSTETPGIRVEEGIIKLDPALYVSPNGER